MSETPVSDTPVPETGAAPVPETETSPRRRSILSRLVRGTLLLAVLVTLGLVAALAWILGTENGLRFAYEKAHRAFPDLMGIEHIEGAFLGDLRLSGVRLDMPAATVTIERFHLGWRPGELFSGRLAIDEILAEGVGVETRPGAEAEEPDAGPIELPELALPLEVDLRSLVVERLEISDPAGPVFGMDRIALAAGWQGSLVQVRELALSLPEPDLDARLEGEVRVQGAYPLDARLDWRMIPVADKALEGHAELTGDLSALKIQHRLGGAAEAEVAGELRDLLDRLSWQGELKVSRVDLPALVADLPGANLTARLAIDGNLERATLTGQITAESEELPDFGKLGADLDLVWADSVLEVRGLTLEEAASKARVALSGKAELREGLGGFDLAADWKDLSWPLKGPAIVSSPDGKLKVAGDLDAFSYELAGRLEGADLPPAKVKGEGTGSKDAAEIAGLRVDTLKGHLLAKGQVSWSPKLEWKAELEAADIDPGSHWAEWPGRLSGRVSTTGNLEQELLRLQAVVDALGGELRGYPVDLKGRVKVEGQEVEIEDVALKSGPTRAQASGTVGERVAAKFSLDSPDLRTLLPGLAGSLSAEGSAEGKLTTPSISLRLKAREVAFAENGVAQADAALDVGLGTDQKVRVDLEASGVDAGGLSWETARIKGDGTLGAHQVVADLSGKPLSVRLDLSGALAADNGYSGSLRALDLGAGELGEWRLGQPAAFSVSGEKLKAGPLCLREEKQDSHGCVSFEQAAAGQWRAKLDWERLALTLVEPYLPDGAEITGAFALQGDFQASGGALKGDARAQIPQGEVRLSLGEGVNALDFGGTDLRLNAGSGGLRADLDLPLRGMGGLEGSLALKGWRLQEPARPNQPLQGRVQGRIDDLGPLAALVPDLTNVKGRLDADVVLKGTLAQPGIDGAVRLEGGAVDVPIAGLKLRDIALALRSEGVNRVEYDGGLRSGSGDLKISGESRLDPREGWVTGIGIKGERLTAVDTAEYRALVSPDLKLEMDRQRIRFGGEVLIPKARITPKSLPQGTVTPSRDVVLLQEAAAGGSGPKVTADVRVVLGDDVFIEGFGLRGGLRGDLRVTQEPGKRPQGLGQLQVEDGIYRISGIEGLAGAGELDIEQGRIIYARTPLDDPGILILANRKSGAVTASLRVSGTLRNPKMTFFSDSDPGMSQSEVLNYLLTGGSSFGSGGDGDGQVVEVGTYVSPRLYMQYEAGLGDKSNKIKMRYDLTNSIQIQTESGDSQGADIFYTFER